MLTDFVFGYRDFSKIPLRHRIGNLIWFIIFNLFVRKRGEPIIKDIGCGYMALSPKAVDYLLKQRDYPNGYCIDSWIKMKALDFIKEEKLKKS